MALILAVCLSAALIKASPVALPQAITQAISPSAPAPPGCTNAYPSSFGIAVVNITDSSSVQKRDSPTAVVADPVSQIYDGQIQAPTVMTVAQVSQIGDGQVQGGMHTIAMMPVTQAAGSRTTWMPADATIAPATTSPPSMPSPGPTSNASAPLYILPSNTSTTSTPTASPTSSTDITSLPNQDVTMVAYKTNTTLTLTLSDGILTDAHGRTGYIASNFQFQFDNPPQSEALLTSGWSVCSNSTLALGGSTVFWQCLSGSFYNLYDQNWAAQCSPVDIRVVDLIDSA